MIRVVVNAQWWYLSFAVIAHMSASAVRRGLLTVDDRDGTVVILRN